MSAVDETTDQQADTAVQDVAPLEQPGDTAGADLSLCPGIPLELGLEEAEALRTWLLKPASDGTTSLDDPLVSRVLARLGLEVEAARATVTVREELVQAGFSADHLSDDQVRELARRIAEAASVGIRN